VTVRAEDPNRYLMGQSVLDLHTLDGVEYPAHAFFSDMQGDNPSTQIQIPLADEDFTEAFCHQFRLQRQTEAGLSIVIPFPNRDLSLQTMLGVAIANYFYPIVTNQLVLEFDGQIITSSNIRELAHNYAASKISDIDELFDFISEIYAMPDDALLPLKSRWVDDYKLGEDDFEEGELDRLRDLFIDRQSVGIRLPLTLTLKNGEQLDTSFKVFVKRPEHLEKGHDLYVRGGLTLPAEAKFRDRKALGAMIAEDGPIASFLGDAENAAHTKWNGRAEKLRRNYRSPERRLRAIRNVLLSFYDILAQAVEDHDEQALRQFFWTKRPESQGRRRSVGPTPLDIPPPPEPRPRPVRLDKTGDGFSIRPGADAKNATYPMTCSVRVAYDTANGNPFRKFDPLDFNFRSGTGPQVALTKETMNILEKEPNSLTFKILDPNFALQVTGFDPNRDLHVILRTLD